MIRAAALNGMTGIAHGFFTRQGGVSSGLYASLNVGLGSSDTRSNVMENRARVATALGTEASHLVTLYQVHSAEARVVRAPWGEAGPAHADALVTDRPGLAIGVLAADCGPILFADPQARIIGAAHAGWKGALAGVLEATVAAMETIGADRARMTAVLGPSISRDAYEVGPEFVATFTAADAVNSAYFSPSWRVGHAMFDLAAYTLDRLRRCGVGTVESIGLCTYADEDRFFSYRRTTHRNEPDYGRQISAISLQ